MKLLERETPRCELDASLKEALAGEGRIVLVSGEVGIGKTSLVEQFTREHQPAIRVLWGACDALFTPRPLGPLLDIAMQLEGELPRLLKAGSDRHNELRHSMGDYAQEGDNWVFLAEASYLLDRTLEAEQASQAAIAIASLPAAAPPARPLRHNTICRR